MKPPVKFVAQIDLKHIPIEEWKAKRMYLQGYRFIGKHSAIKVCEWTKKAIKGKSSCYKNKFYGISSSQCIQMSPAVYFCDFNCLHCWRSLNFEIPKEDFKWDFPEEIFKGCIEQHRKYLFGFKGDDKIQEKRKEEARNPKHFAISLSGEPCLYPYLPELIDIIKSNGMTAFLVTNGVHPEMLSRLLNHQPTNLYITLHAPNEELYQKECCPAIKDGWEKMQESLSLLKEFSCDTVIRLTLSKHSNMQNPEQYAELIEKSKSKFVEVKAYMPIGGARVKMGFKAMPLHEEIVAFAKEIEKHSSYKIINEKEDSRVVLMSRG